MRGGEPQVFFSSPDKLAPGAVEHQNNIYEWSHGQVFRLVSAQEGQQSPYPRQWSPSPFSAAPARTARMSTLSTPETLNWEAATSALDL